MFIHDIDPVLVEIGPLAIRYYGLLYAVGIIGGFLLCQSLMKRQGHGEAIFNRLIIYIVVGLVLGAHFTHLLFYAPESVIRNPIRLVQFGKGLASHGGFAGAIFALWLFRRRNRQWNRISFWRYLDIITIGGAFLGPLIRLGNFFNSEIYGRVTDSPFGVAFRRLKENAGKPEAELVYRHPSQLYEMLIGIGIFLVLYLPYRKHWQRLKDGTVFFSFVILYFTSRFLVEFLKEYQALPQSFPLTMGQVLSIPLVVFGVVMFVKKRCHEPHPAR